MKTLLLLLLTISAAISVNAKNTAVSLFEDNLVMYINFDDSKGAPVLMDGNIKFKAAAKNAFVDGVSGKAFTGGRLNYTLDFTDVTFNTETTFVFWLALMTDDKSIDGKTLNPISIYGKGGTMLIQRQGWKKQANLLSTVAIPKKKGPLVRLFHTAGTANWKKGQWHMVSVSWDTNKYSICVDGEKTAQVLLNSPLSVYYNDKTGKIRGMGISLAPNTFAIDEVMVFNRNLSADELKKLYEITKNKNIGQ
ncbi:MAG: hypothetical protein IKB77_04995 [Lentisphaeria bacterium]|nr:hypothetical protein [Lentisphaeria bacterium]